MSEVLAVENKYKKSAWVCSVLSWVLLIVLGAMLWDEKRSKGFVEVAALLILSILCVIPAFYANHRLRLMIRLPWLCGVVAGLLYAIAVIYTLYPNEMWMIWVGMLGAFILCVPRAKRVFGELHYRWVASDLILATGIVVLIRMQIVSVAATVTQKKIEVAERKWAEIGFPMETFDRRQRLENEALREFQKNLAFLNVKSLYRLPNGEIDPAKVVTEDILKILEKKWEGYSDLVSKDGMQGAYLDEHASQLLELYEKTLALEAPRWRLNPEDTYDLVPPNFLNIRKLAQLATVDAYWRLAHGDVTGAQKAIRFVEHFSEDLKESHLLVSTMIAVAVDALIRPVKVYLPAESDSWEKNTREVSAMRTALYRSIQMEAWGNNRWAAKQEAVDIWDPRWFQQADHWEFWRYMCAGDSYLMAEIVSVISTPDVFHASDLNAEIVEIIANRANGITIPNVNRAFHRLNVTLVLNEQLEMIRLARERFYEGQFDAREFSSAAIPGSKWRVKIDHEQGSVSMNLEPLPAWVTDSEVISSAKNFYPLPFNGSKSWKFAPKPVGSLIEIP